MKNILYLSLLVLFSNNSFGQVPDWYRQEMQRQVGAWIADNSAYQNEQESDDAYGLDWKWAPGKQGLTGILYGLKSGKRTADYWHFIQYWDAKAKAVKVVQIGASGMYGEGYLRMLSPDRSQLEQVFTSPDGQTNHSGHRTEIAADHEVSTSYAIDGEGNWQAQRTYHWKKQAAPIPNDSYQLYLTRIAAAEAFLQLNEISTARRYLDACRAEYRGLEWHFLDRYLDQSDTSISKSGKPALTALQLSPDEKLLAVGDADSIITLYTYPQLEIVHELRGHKGAITSLDFSSDGSRLVSGSRDHAVIVWDVKKGSMLHADRSSFSQGIYQVRFSPDDQQIGVVSWELRNEQPRVMGFAKILNAKTGDVLQKIETEPHPASGIVFTDEGKSIIVSCWGEMVISYDLATAAVKWQYDLSDPEEYNSFHSLDLSPDGQHLALGNTDHRVHILDTQSGELIHRIEPWEGHSKIIKAVQYSPDGQWLATAGEDQTILVWRTSDYEQQHALIGHTNTVQGLAWTNDRSRLLSVSADGSMKSWNMEQPFVKTYEVCDYGPWQLPVTPDQSSFAAPCSDEQLAIYDIHTGEQQNMLAEQSGLCGDFSNDGQLLVTASFDGIVRVWDIDEEQEVNAFTGHDSRVDGVSFLDNTGCVASVGDSTLRIWSLTDNKQVIQLSFPARPVRVISTPDESRLFVGLSDGNVSIVDTGSGQIIGSFAADRSLSELAVSPDGRYLAVFNGPVINIWDIATGKHRFALEDHERSGYAIAFSPDSRYLISGSYDQTFKLWDMSNGQCTLTFHGYDETVYSARFLDNRRLLIGSSQGKMRYYDFR